MLVFAVDVIVGVGVDAEAVDAVEKVEEGRIVAGLLRLASINAGWWAAEE